MSVASNNIYALLGNDEEGTENPAPVKTVTKTIIKTGKANADGTASASPTSGGRPGGRGGFTDAQKAFRAGREGNLSRPTDEPTRAGARGGRGARGRGGRGATHHRNADDRHTKNIVPGSEKQAAQSWGATEGDAELNDEQAGEAIAQAEQKDAEAEDAEAEPQEPEPKQIPYATWKAEQEAQAAELNATISTREVDKEVPAEHQEYVRDDGEVFMGGFEVKPRGKGKKDKPSKVIVAWEDNGPATREAHSGPTRGRGGDRGDRRGGPRGGAPRGAPRGGAPRGGDGFSRGGARGGARGGRDAVSPTLKINDPEAFPSLGGK